MGTLEKILEEIDAHSIEFEMFGVSDDYISVGWVKEIIRKHMNDGWIPVEEALPEDGEEVLCTDGKHVYLVEYDADCDAPFDDINGIIAWQPSPEPYQAERSDNHDRK